MWAGRSIAPTFMPSASTTPPPELRAGTVSVVCAALAELAVARRVGQPNDEAPGSVRTKGRENADRSEVGRMRGMTGSAERDASRSQ